MHDSQYENTHTKYRKFVYSTRTNIKDGTNMNIPTQPPAQTKE